MVLSLFCIMIMIICGKNMCNCYENNVTVVFKICFIRFGFWMKYDLDEVHNIHPPIFLLFAPVLHVNISTALILSYINRFSNKTVHVH